MDISRYGEEGFNEFLQSLIDKECIEGAAFGITKKVIEDGYDSLTDKQKYVFDKYVIDACTIPKCSLCDDEVPWCEMQFAYNYSGYCSWCFQVRLKEFKDIA